MRNPMRSRDELDAIAREITDEAERAMTKFAMFNSPHEGYAVLLEELDEMWDDIKANRVPESVEEAVQVGAMALRYIADVRMLTELRESATALLQQP